MSGAIDTWTTPEDSSWKPKSEGRLVARYSVNAPPGTIESRVFIGGSYTLMPILREIESVVRKYGFQPIVAIDFEIPIERTRDYTLRLMHQCKFAIFEVTLTNGHLAEIARSGAFPENTILQVYMAIDERKARPKTMSIMIWQASPPPQGYTSIRELNSIVKTFLSRTRTVTRR